MATHRQGTRLRTLWVLTVLTREEDDQGFAISSPRGSAQPRRVNTYYSACAYLRTTPEVGTARAHLVRGWEQVGGSGGPSVESGVRAGPGRGTCRAI